MDTTHPEFETCVAVYPCTEGTLDWLAHRFDAVERRGFEHFQAAQPLVERVYEHERGEISDFVLHAAIQGHNARHRTHIRREDLLTFNTGRVWADAGDWVVFTDSAEDLYRSRSPNIELAAYGAAESMKWAMLYLPHGSTLTVYRSRRLDNREFWPQANRKEAVTLLPAALGLVRGAYPTFVLPPEVEGLIRQEQRQ